METELKIAIAVFVSLSTLLTWMVFIGFSTAADAIAAVVGGVIASFLFRSR